MKYEEAIKIIKNRVNCYDSFKKGECPNSCFMCEYKFKSSELIEAKRTLVSYHDKNRWHDLRKDPDDLPTKDGYYLCTFEDSIKPEVWCYFDDAKSFGEWRTDYHYELDSCPIETYFEPFDEEENSVIAWRHIEPFEAEV